VFIFAFFFPEGGGGVFKCGRPRFLVQKLLIFWNLWLCPAVRTNPSFMDSS